MPILGYDMVVRCRACPETARVRVAGPNGQGPRTAADMIRVLTQLTEQGFEQEGAEYVCYRHGGGGAEGPEPAPVLQREKG